MKKKLAILSNVNCNPLIRALKEEYEVYEPEGYGNELMLLLDSRSSYHAFSPEITFLWVDLMELIHHRTNPEEAAAAMEEWFQTLEPGIGDSGSYFISDGYLWGAETAVLPEQESGYQLEEAFRQRLESFCERHENVYILPYCSLVRQLGEENAFSLITWNIGKIPYSQAMQKRMCKAMEEKIQLSNRVAKKVLVLDLDNTLWGGLAGEAELTPVQLSEEHTGLAYKNFQRVLKQMQKQGVMLAIASKNNEADALEIIEKHPHMVLRREDFVSVRINWNIKADNLREMAQELNVGLDSFVFFDDSKAEREQIEQMLPQVTVPEFPQKPEKLAETMVSIYHDYFEKLTVTKEDREKTAQYAANAKRRQLQEKAVDLASYLKQLDIVISVEDGEKNRERLHQLVNKTNQFNLTTIRYEREILSSYLKDARKKIRLYRVADKFGDNGIVGAVIVDVSGEEPEIEEFVLSCRVMGRFIEYAIIDKLEQELKREGYSALRACYVRTVKNKPVEKLYEELGYEVIADSGEEKKYRRSLAEDVNRVYYIKEWKDFSEDKQE